MAMARLHCGRGTVYNQLEHYLSRQGAGCMRYYPAGWWRVLVYTTYTYYVIQWHMTVGR